MKSIALFSRPDTPQAWGVLNEIAVWASKLNVKAIVPSPDNYGWTGTHWDPAYCQQVRDEADMAIAIGGDGTLLGVARVLFGSDIPLVGVNMGTLGYLTDVAAKDIDKMMEQLVAGSFSIEKRILLAAQLSIEGTSHGLPERAFNEVAIRSRFGRLAEYDVYVDGQAVFNLKADGLVITTPTGSTAYALSAQGPILHPSLDAIAIVPLTPHSLTARPITLPAGVTVEVIARGGSSSRVYCDGIALPDTLSTGKSVQVQKAKGAVPLVHFADYSLFNTLRQKLHWGTPRD